MENILDQINRKLTVKYKLLPSLFLLSTLSFLLFIVPITRIEYQQNFYFSAHIILIFATSLLLNKNRKVYFFMAIILVLMRIADKIFPGEISGMLINMLSVVFMIWVSVSMVSQVIKQSASLEIVLDAISGYLLVGVAYTFINLDILLFFPDSFTHGGEVISRSENVLSIMSYYTFITYTSTGYGDILPISSVAMAMSKFIVITGQIYISIVIAIIIGKYMQMK